MTGLASLYKAVSSRLSGGGNWGTRVYADVAPSGVETPYVVYFLVGGGDRLISPVHHARYVLTVKCVSNSPTSAITGAAHIQTLLRDQGAQEGAGMTGDDDWWILTVTQDRVVSITEMEQNSDAVFHHGHQYQFMMEAK